ncbi:MAG: hypothetical protein ABL949_14205 [Fimbriimonadaceae bacterium]
MFFAAAQEFDWSKLNLGWIPLAWTGLCLLFWVIIQCRIVGKTGNSPWLGILWSLPVLGFFFQVWLVLADWPATRTNRRKSTAKPKRRKK